MSNCCVQPVPPDSSYETLAQPILDCVARLTAGLNRSILSRGTVMTRGGIDALREQLFAECLRQGIGQAAEVLVVANGAMWIWNLV